MSYPKFYKPRDLWDQVEIIEQVIPIKVNKSLIDNVMQAPLPNGAESLFVIPKLKGSYVLSLLNVLSIIEMKRSFHSHVTLEKKKLLRDERTCKSLKILSNVQNGEDVIIVPAQFGARHVNKSVESVRESMLPNEFGLGAHDVGWMLFTHLTERQNEFNGIHLDCPGDIYSGKYHPYFDYFERRMDFDMRKSNDPISDIGSVTGFLSDKRVV